jgi:hypothetical protein
MARPRTDPVDKVRTRVWFEQVLIEARAWSAYELEKMLSPEQVYRGPEGTVRPCRWDKYRRGDNTPSAATREFVAARFRGPQSRWDSPIWRIFKGETVTRSDVVKGLGNLAPDTAGFLTERSSNGSLDLRPFATQFFEFIDQTISYDTFETMVLVARLADIIRDEDLWETVTNIYRLRRKDLLEDRIIARLHPELYGLADAFCRPRWRTSRGEVIYIDCPWLSEFPYRRSDGEGEAWPSVISLRKHRHISPVDPVER